MKNNKVLFLTNLPSPYIVAYLNELGKKCSLTAIFEREKSNARDSSWKKYNFINFCGIILKGINIKVNQDLDDAAICPQVIKYLKKGFYDSIIVANPCTPTGIIAIYYMKICHIPYTIQSEGGFPGSGKGLKEKLKRSIMKNADLYLSTAKLGDEYFLKYGADKKRIKRFPFSSLHLRDIPDCKISKYEKEALKSKLEIPYKKVVISVGRFIKLKGFEGLIESFVGFDNDIGLYIIGGKPTEKYLELCKKNNLENVKFIDFVDKETIRLYYQCADLFVLNTHSDTWGLVINEAMAYGLPIVSTNRCYAALALIENKKNGYIVKPDDIKEIHKRVAEILRDEYLAESMSVNNISKAQVYTIETMAEKIYQNVKTYQSSWKNFE